MCAAASTDDELHGAVNRNLPLSTTDTADFTQPPKEVFMTVVLMFWTLHLFAYSSWGEGASPCQSDILNPT